MTPASQTANPAELSAPIAHPHLHAPQPGATATLIHDLRELFKVKVVGLVLVTGWGGFYLGSMLSGISSVQRGLLDTLLGIGLVSAGAGALNEALERKTDARMKRTADRPLASGRFSLAQGIIAGLGALALGAGPYLGRIPAYLTAATTTWALNRAWTFKASSSGPVARQWALFVAVNLLGFALNYGTYAACIAFVPLAAAHPVLAVAAGSIAGLFSNFFLSRLLVFTPPR